jgi:hypothetical protein
LPEGRIFAKNFHLLISFPGPKSMKELHKAVALELGVRVTIQSASNFRPKATAIAEKAAAGTEEDKETTLIKFLGDHWDTHALSITFFSFSSTNSFVYYKLQNKIVAKLRIPAEFLIVVTTEIHSGLLSLNPYRVKYCSESADDRLLFRIVHEVSRDGIDMSRTSESWLEFATDAVEKIFYRKLSLY